MMRQGNMTPTVYVETSENRLDPQTIVKVVWDESHVERRIFATLAEALEFARSLCDTDDGVTTV